MNRRPDPPAVAAHDADALIGRARAILAKEAEGLALLGSALDATLAEAVATIVARTGGDRTGRLVVTGIGKSGHIAAKLASTFSSTGTPSLYLHAAEAAHGDLGMIMPGDVLLAISRSGDSRELYAVVDYCRAPDVDVPVIAVTMRTDSPLARRAAVVLRLPDVEEVCPNNLAPTTSALVTLALGDVLAVLLMERRAFGEADFAQFHPGGRLGRGLATARRYIDEFGAEVPSVGPDTPMKEVISAVANGRKGCVVVLDAGALAGLITEGDLRRAYGPDMFAKAARDVMTRKPVTIDIDASIREAVALMTERRIANILVIDRGRVVEILDTKDLMQRGYL